MILCSSRYYVMSGTTFNVRGEDVTRVLLVSCVCMCWPSIRWYYCSCTTYSGDYSWSSSERGGVPHFLCDVISFGKSLSYMLATTQHSALGQSQVVYCPS